MPSSTTTFVTNDIIDNLVTYEIQLDLATEADIPIERRLAIAITGSILLSNALRVPRNLYLPVEKTFLEHIEIRITHLLSEVGDSLGELEQDHRPDPEDEEDEDHREDHRPPGRPSPGWSEYDNLPYDEGEDDWNRDSNWGAW